MHVKKNILLDFRFVRFDKNKFMTSENSDSFLLVGKTNDKSMNDFFHGFPNLRLNNHSNIKSISISSLYRVKAITSLYKPTKFYSENFQFHRTPT